MMQNSKIIITEIPLFKGLCDDLIQAIQSILIHQSFEKDFPLYIAGEPVDRMFIINNGSIAVLEPISHTPLISIRDGQFAMEVALIFENFTPQCDAVVTSACCDVCVLKRCEFIELLAQYPRDAELVWNRNIHNYKPNLIVL